VVDGVPLLKFGTAGQVGDNTLSIYRPTYLQPHEFHDSRYDPSFSPILYPGYTVSCRVMLPKDAETPLQARLYAHDLNSGKDIESDPVVLQPGQWETLTFAIPHMDHACLSKAGVRLDTLKWMYAKRNPIDLYITDFDFRGQADYSVDFACERMEFWNGLHKEVSQFSFLKGIWTLEGGELSGSCADFGEAYTGDYAWRDLTFSVDVTPQTGNTHMALFRVQGAVRSYAAALTANGLEILKNDNGYKSLACVPFDHKKGETYQLTIAVKGDAFSVSCQGVTVTAKDDTYSYGCIGVGLLGGAHAHFNHISVHC
jgi:hypothetical protein